MTQADLAAAVALDRSSLARIENGTRRVSALELARIAGAVDERIEWSVRPVPPSVISHRNLQEPGAAEFVTGNVGHPQAETPILTRPATATEADAAIRARALLGADPDGPVPGLADRMAAQGLFAFLRTACPERRTCTRLREVLLW